MSGLMARSKQGLASSKGRPSPLLAWPMVVVISVTLASTHSSTLLINYQSGVGGGGGGNGLGLLPNGYNVAASNSAMNQQMLQQQQQQQQQHQQQQQDPNQYHPSDQTGSQTQAQDQYAPQASPIAPQQNSGSNHLLQQYSNSMRNNNNLANQQQQQQQPQQQQSASLGGGSSSGSGSGISERETGPIFRLQGSAMNGSSVKLVWSIERGYSADSFEIKYGPIPNHEVFTLALNGSAREATINSLQPDTLYQFTLWGYSDDNGGGGSGGAHIWRPRLITIKTPKLNDQGQAAGTMRQLAEDGQITPLGVKAEAKSNQSIQLSWTEQERPASLQNLKRINIIRYYVVNNNSTQGAAGLPQQTEPYSSSSSSSSQANSSAVQVGSSIKYHYLNVTEMQNRDNRIIIQKLKPATEYAFAVKTAYVSPDTKKTYRHSGFSMDTSARTFDLEPSAPRNFSIQPMQLTSDEIKAGTTIPKLELTWSAPESPNGQLRGYVILYAHEVNLPDDKWFRIPVNDSNINNWYVANLRPGASYYFKMRAINQRGQSPDTETRLFIATPSPSAGQQPSFSSPHPQQPTLAPSQPIGGGGMIGAPIPPNNILLMIVLCLIAIFFILFLVVSCLVCRSRSNGRSSKGRRKGSLQLDNSNSNNNNKSSHNSNDLNGDSFASSLNNNNNSSQSSTVAGRVGTLARRSRLQQNDHHLTNSNNNSKPDFWISAMDQQQAIAAAAAAAANSSEIKSNISEKSGSDINMAAMVSIQRDSPQQFTTQTTQLAPILPEYRFAANGQQQLAAEQQLMQQIQQQQQQGHYHTGHHHQFGGTIGFDQMDNANAALMTLTKRQQQQLQKYQIQFASTAGATMGPHSNHQAPSPHQQPPPPPPLNIEQQQHQQQQQNQSLYGTHQQSGTAAHLNNTRSLRLHRPTLYDPVSGSFVQQDTPPNYNSHLNSMLNGVHHQLQSFNNNNQQQQTNNTVTSGSNTLQFHHHPHQTSTLMSRRSTNTLRSFQSGGGGLYGQLGGQFAAPPVPPTSGNGGGPPTSGNGGGPPHLLQNHQAVINQLNHPSLPLKHVSAVRPQIMSSLEDQIEMELAEKQAEQQHLQSQQQQQQQSQQQQQQQQQHGPPSMVQQQD